MGIGIKELLVILLIVLVLFGRGRITAVLGEVGKGIRAMREGLKGDAAEPAKSEPASLTASEEEKKS